jgi:intein/homing endonuclease
VRKEIEILADFKDSFKIIEKQHHVKGEIYRIRINSSSIAILFTHHALERINRWGLSLQSVLESLLYPEEVIVGHRDRYIAHRRYGDHLVRAVYEYEKALPVLITAYYPKKNRYFVGGETYADKIFRRR